MNSEKNIEIAQEELVSAIEKIMKFCQQNGMSELMAYMAMISITNTMEETLGFGYQRRTDD